MEPVKVTTRGVSLPVPCVSGVFHSVTWSPWTLALLTASLAESGGRPFWFLCEQDSRPRELAAGMEPQACAPASHKVRPRPGGRGSVFTF